MDSRLSQETPISKEAVTFWDLFYTYPPRSRRNFLSRWLTLITPTVYLHLMRAERRHRLIISKTVP